MGDNQLLELGRNSSRLKHLPRQQSRVMENISRGPTFGDFVTILTERSEQDVTVEGSWVIFPAIAVTRKIVQCYCVHVVVYRLYVQLQSTTVIPADITKGESALYLYSSN
jgi:hypothetical protein